MDNEDDDDNKISSLADVIERLDKPKEYLRSIYENMQEYEKTHGKANVKIGNTGKGHFPNYRFEPITPHFRAFDGRYHKILQPDQFVEDNWSEKPSTIEEVELLIGKVSKR